MEPRTLQFVAESVGAAGLSFCSRQVKVFGVSTDSRKVRRGDLFVALKGERFDAHEFLNEVLRSQPAGLLVERIPGEVSRATPILKVENTRLALGRLASAYRRQHEICAVAVVGSNGKTSTKELIASVLRRKFPIVWSEASFNNEIGVPITLLRLEKSHQAAVLEVGTNHPGELAPLLQMIQPQWGVITSIGREHLEHFKSIEAVVEEEGTITSVLTAAGKLFVNGDDSRIETIASRTQAEVIRVGFQPNNSWRAEGLTTDSAGTRFSVRSPWWDGREDFEIQLLGKHQVANALLAMAVGKEMGLGIEEIRNGLKQSPPAKMRLQMTEAGGVRLLDDSYNANADSMNAALETLASLRCEGQRIAILGDMAELGHTSEAAHQEIGKRAAELGIDVLVGVGQMARIIVESGKAAGIAVALAFESVEEASENLAGIIRKGDLILLKASRATGLERLTQSLKEKLK